MWDADRPLLATDLAEILGEPAAGSLGTLRADAPAGSGRDGAPADE